MKWSMSKPEFKTDLFRLVDVLPTLRSEEAILSHVSLYLKDSAKDLNPILAWLLDTKPETLMGSLVRFGVNTGVTNMASQFIAGATPEDALPKLKKIRAKKLAFTVDLLGEYSVSEVEALEYLKRYEDCLEVFGREIHKWDESSEIIEDHRGEYSPVCISVKLSALYSQCSVLNFKRSVSVLSERLAMITSLAKKVDATIYVDAEDCANNPVIYESFKRVFSSQEFKHFHFPGIVLQAYAKGSEDIADLLLEFSRSRGSPIAIRLVKGAYWDHETVMATQYGLPSPLFAKKESSDANYEKLSRKLLDNIELVMPAFGSHNIRSISHACQYAKEKNIPNTKFELQMLYGMADPIAEAFKKESYLVRLYVPLGDLVPGMGYLVRRLLENTSNESFLRHTFFDAHAVKELLKKPAFAG